MKKKDPTSHRIIEKRRRDRMNNCLADLSKLIPAHYMKKGRGRIEKTEIIEMAIKHLKDLIRQTSASSLPSSSGPSHQPANTNTATATTIPTGIPVGLAGPPPATLATTTNHQQNGIKPSTQPRAHATHCSNGPGQQQQMQLEVEARDVEPASQMSCSSNSSSSCSLSSLSPGDNRAQSTDNSSTPMMICSDSQLLEPSSNKRRAPLTTTQSGAHQQLQQRRHHHHHNHHSHKQVNGFISDQDFEHLANVNNTLATFKMEPSSPAATLPLPLPLPLVTKTGSSPAPATNNNTGAPSTSTPSNKSYHNHYHSGSNSHHHHHHHHHHAQTSANSAPFSGSVASASSLNTPALPAAANNDSSGGGSGSGSEGLATESSSSSGALTSAAHQHHHQLHKYRSSPNSSGSDSGGSSSSYGSSGDNGAGSSGNMSGSSSGHRAGGSSCSMRTSCSSSSVTSMMPGNPNRPIGLVVDRGTTTSLQAAMAAATVNIVNKPVGADSSAGSSSISLNSISSDVMMAASPVRSLNGSGTVPQATGAVNADGVIECCSCGARILQTLYQQKAANNGSGGSSSDSSMSSNGPNEKPTALTNKSQSASNQAGPDSLDFSAKTTILGSGKQPITSTKRRPSNGDNKCNSLMAASMRPASARPHSNSSTGSHLSPHSTANSSSASSTSNSSLSLASSNSSAAWYKKAWLVRSFSRSPTLR